MYYSSTQMNGPIVTSYESNFVPIPSSYLLSTPADAKPIIAQRIDFSKTTLREYSDCYATVLDHVLSPSECTTLLQLAEASVRDEDQQASSSPWRPALVNAGTRNGKGFEMFLPDVRNNDRIIWDSQEIVDRLWARIASVAEVREELRVHREGKGARATEWDFHNVNERMRFLKYAPGQYFQRHCDGEYRPPVGEDGIVLSTKYTIHLYLNDSKNEADLDGPETELEGGATSFLSELDDFTKVDVDPKAGRVLIFQHRFLCHCGATVTAGTKYTVRTDIMYKMRRLMSTASN